MIRQSGSSGNRSWSQAISGIAGAGNLDGGLGLYSPHSVQALYNDEGVGGVITVRKSEDRGHFDHGWLITYHTFSFDQYYDPDFMGFRTLRVLNEDRVGPSRGFPMHSHRDMEIVTYVLAGKLAHQDSMGTGSVIRRGDVQRMTAGQGIRHSEANPSDSEIVHFFQVWIHPNEKGLNPEYKQKTFPDADKTNRLLPIVSPDGRNGSLSIHQDAVIYCAILEQGKDVEHHLVDGRHAWVQVATGAIRVNGKLLEAGDGAAASEEESLRILAEEPAELLLFDLS